MADMTIGPDERDRMLDLVERNIERAEKAEREREVLRSRIAELEGEVRRATNRLSGMTQRAHRAESAETLVKLEQERSSAMAEMSEANCACMVMNDEMSKLQLDLRQAEARIAELEAALATANGAREKVCEVVDRRDTEIAALRKTVNDWAPFMAAHGAGGCLFEAVPPVPIRYTTTCAATRYRCPDCSGVGRITGNGIWLNCSTCGGTGAVTFDPGTERKGT